MPSRHFPGTFWLLGNLLALSRYFPGHLCSAGMAALNLSSLVTSPESLAFELSAEAADSTLSHKEWRRGRPDEGAVAFQAHP